MRSGFILIGFAATLAGCTVGSASDEPAAVDGSTREAAAPAHPRAVVVDCSMRSMADFGPAFRDGRNLVVGPLVLIGGARPVAAATVLAVDGQKYPVLLRAGHRATVELDGSVRSTAGLAYGPLPQGRVRVEDAHDRITFLACRHSEPSGSSAGGPVTFWSGFVMTRAPDCLPLDVYIDGERAPRRAVVPAGPGPC